MADDQQFHSQAPAEFFSFDSADYPVDERFPRYRSLYARGADAIVAGPRFEAGVRGWRLDRAVLYERRLNDVIHQRDARRVKQDGFDHFTLTTVFSGRYEFDAGSGFKTVAPGRAVLLDMTKPMRNRSQSAHFVTISLARERILSSGGTTDSLHGTILGRERLGLLFDFIQSMIERSGGLSQDMLPPVMRAFTSLLSVALADGGPGRLDPPDLPAGEDRLDKVRSLISAHILNPELEPATIADMSGLSRATLYRLFKAEGGIAAYIQRRRVDILRAALSDSHERRSFAKIAEAVGFQSESHASRLFFERFGVRPREFRASLGASRPEGPKESHMGYWLDELR